MWECLSEVQKLVSQRLDGGILICKKWETCTALKISGSPCFIINGFVRFVYKLTDLESEENAETKEQLARILVVGTIMPPFWAWLKKPVVTCFIIIFQPPFQCSFPITTNETAKSKYATYYAPYSKSPHCIVHWKALTKATPQFSAKEL